MRRFARSTVVLLVAAALQGCSAADSEDSLAPDPAIGEQRALQDARSMIDERVVGQPEAMEAQPSTPTP